MIFSVLLLIIFLCSAYFDYKKNKFIFSPILLLSFMHIIVLFIQLFAYLIYQLKPKYLINFGSFIIIILSYFSFYIGSNIVVKKTYKKNVEFNNISYPFYITALIGILGTIISLKNMDISGNPILLFIYNFNYFDSMFKTSSIGSILWIANTAALFWYNFAKKNNLNKIIVIICFINIFFHAAYIYIIVALFYFYVPYYFIHLKNKNILHIIIIFGFILSLIPLLNYKAIGLYNRDYFIKIYPYTAGCISNLAYYGNQVFQNGPENRNNINNMFRDLGFGQIMIYIDKYFNTRLYEEPKNNGFLQQIEGIDAKGNVQSIFVISFKNPIILGMAFMFIIGLISQILLKYSNKSIFLLSCFCFFSAANFLSFEGGGHFSTTRFFPALIYIWPFIFINYILKNASKNISVEFNLIPKLSKDSFYQL